MASQSRVAFLALLTWLAIGFLHQTIRLASRRAADAETASLSSTSCKVQLTLCEAFAVHAWRVSGMGNSVISWQC